MRKNTKSGLRAWKSICTFLIGCLMALTVSSQPATHYSDDQLFDLALDAYNTTRWTDAATFLYAYVQRSPADYLNNTAHTKQVNDALDFSRRQLNNAMTERDACRTQVTDLQRKLAGNGPVSSSSGLTEAPPPLRKIIKMVVTSRTTANGKDVYLSDLPESASGNIFQGLGKDKPYWAASIMIGSNSYAKGLCMYPIAGKTAFVEYDLGGNFGEIYTQIGIGRNAMGQGGSVRFMIYGDGQRLFNKVQSQNDAPFTINFSLNGVKKLRLEVEDAGGIKGDYAIWGDIKVIRR